MVGVRILLLRRGLIPKPYKSQLLIPDYNEVNSAHSIGLRADKQQQRCAKKCGVLAVRDLIEVPVSPNGNSY